MCEKTAEYHLSITHSLLTKHSNIFLDTCLKASSPCFMWSQCLTFFHDFENLSLPPQYISINQIPLSVFYTYYLVTIVNLYYMTVPCSLLNVQSTTEEEEVSPVGG